MVILPIIRKEQDTAVVMEYCEKLQKEIRSLNFCQEPVLVDIDSSDIPGGEKYWRHVKRGVPIRLEIGPRDIASDSLFISLRNQIHQKFSLPRQQFLTDLPVMLQKMQDTLYQNALNFQKTHSHEFTDLNAFKDFFSDDNPGGFAYVFSSDDGSIDALLKEYKISARCIPLNTFEERGKCIFTQKANAKKTIYAKAY